MGEGQLSPDGGSRHSSTPEVVDRIIAVAAEDVARLRFLSDLAHEVRTPLAIIAGYLALAREGAIPTTEALSVVEIRTAELLTAVEGVLRRAEDQLRERGAMEPGTVDAVTHARRVHELGDHLIRRATRLQEQRRSKRRGSGEKSSA